MQWPGERKSTDPNGQKDRGRISVQSMHKQFKNPSTAKRRLRSIEAKLADK